ncbi:unnamed protein product [Prunus brigantina]
MNSFGGVFPSFIGLLEKLKYLDLSGLSFVGTDLQWLATLSSLKYLNLGGVNLIKTTSYWLPTVNMLPSLVELHLPSCRLSLLPLTLPSINFTSLSVLDLSSNKFTSTIPPWLFNLTKLEIYFELSGNSLQGSIPKSIGNLTSLEEFNLGGNQMSGIIPESLGELSSLVSLDIYGNTWEGAITETHFMKLGGLRKIDLTTVVLCNARISGTIPDWFLQLDLQLDYLDLGLIIWPAGSWADGGPPVPLKKSPARLRLG